MLNLPYSSNFKLSTLWSLAMCDCLGTSSAWSPRTGALLCLCRGMLAMVVGLYMLRLADTYLAMYGMVLSPRVG